MSVYLFFCLSAYLFVYYLFQVSPCIGIDFQEYTHTHTHTQWMSEGVLVGYLVDRQSGSVTPFFSLSFSLFTPPLPARLWIHGMHKMGRHPALCIL